MKNKDSLIIGIKQGIQVYSENPSVVSKISTTTKRLKIGDNKKGFIIDNNTGELSVGGAGFYEYKEVDNTKFVKIFLDGIKQAAGLS